MAVLVLVALLVVLAYFRAKLPVWSVSVAALLGWYAYGYGGPWVPVLAVFAVVAAVLNIVPLRRLLLAKPLFSLFRKMLPPMSKTEREALEAGTVWWDAELFSGKPEWKKLLAEPAAKLTAEEQAFIDGPVEELCRMLNDWQIVHELRDLPPEAWQFLKDKGFFGMIIPKEYGGLGFSALANSTVIMKLSSRSVTAAVTAMVPNSLGPAELLLHYGTKEQKDYYLPRLAKGEEVPCFALTGPDAGSDASSIPDKGIVCRGEFKGKEIIGIRLTWEKRYITLGPVATVIGLAFKLYDPDRLLGDREDIGITCALVPAELPGITIGSRHDPLGVPFSNGPTWGKDVFIPIDFIIGGRGGAGQGWRMLMESLAAGRGISLPALSTGAGKLVSRGIGAHARIRKQFNLPIGRFEGVGEALSRIGGTTYLMDAARVVTCGAIDQGSKPSVISAIVKYHLTERMRRVVNDGMDVQGGNAICLGPRNYMGNIYQSVPIGITVEGSNILTRTMIIFGQAVIRCHPFVRREMEAAADPDRGRGLLEFDRAFFGHIGFTLSTAVRSFFLGLTGGRPASVPGGAGKSYFRQGSRFSAAFTLTADIAMMVLGGQLKRKEKLSGRLADILSNLYLLSALLKDYRDRGEPADERYLFRWGCDDCLYNIQQGFDGFLQNFPNRPVAWVLRLLVFPLGKHFAPPSDRLAHKVADLLLEPSPVRDRLTAGIYIPRDIKEPIGRVEDALLKVIAAEPLEKKLREAVKAKKLEALPEGELVEAGVKAGVIDGGEAEVMRAALAARREVITVDDFVRL